MEINFFNDYDKCSLFSLETKASSHRFSDASFSESNEIFNLERTKVSSLAYLREPQPQFNFELPEKQSNELCFSKSSSEKSNILSQSSCLKYKEIMGSKNPSSPISILSVDSINSRCAFSENDIMVVLNEIDLFIKNLASLGYKNNQSSARSHNRRVPSYGTLSSMNSCLNSIACQESSQYQKSCLNDDLFSLRPLRISRRASFISTRSSPRVSMVEEEMVVFKEEPKKPNLVVNRYTPSLELTKNHQLIPEALLTVEKTDNLSLKLDARSTPDFKLRTKVTPLQKKEGFFRRFNKNLQPGTRKYLYIFFLGFFVPLIWIFGSVVVLADCRDLKSRPQPILNANTNIISESLQENNENFKWAFLCEPRFWKLVIIFMSLAGFLEIGILITFLIIYLT